MASPFPLTDEDTVGTTPQNSLTPKITILEGKD